MSHGGCARPDQDSEPGSGGTGWFSGNTALKLYLQGWRVCQTEDQRWQHSTPREHPEVNWTPEHRGQPWAQHLWRLVTLGQLIICTSDSSSIKNTANKNYFIGLCRIAKITQVKCLENVLVYYKSFKDVRYHRRHHHHHHPHHSGSTEYTRKWWETWDWQEKGQCMRLSITFWEGYTWPWHA